MIKKDKKTQLSRIEDIAFVTLTDLSVGQLLPTVIDDVMVSIYEGYHTIFPPMTMGRFDYNNTWKKGVGGVFNKDVLDFSRNKETGKYLHVQSPTVNCIIRLITEEETERFTLLGLVHGHIKDASYMVLRNLESPDSLLTNIEDFRSDSVVPHEDIIFYEEANAEGFGLPVSMSEDFEPHVGSLSLFSE
jgi:hypothetical protein